jgi:diguanylate cyclase (GGDEF)-like protein
VDDRINEVERFTHPPLLSEQVVALTVDHNGWQWIGQDAGVSIFDGNNWRSLTQNDGLIWNDIDSSALMEDKDGSMWIGTSGGLSHILAPQAVRFGPPPVPALTEMLYGANPLTNGAQFPWSGNSLRISMSSLLFRETRTIHLRYRLLGQETEWKDTFDKTLEYSRLAPGDYRFQVAAVDALSASQSPIAEISFRILPLWWQMLAVQMLVGLAGAIAAVILIQWGVRRHLRNIRNKQLRERSARSQGEDRVHEESEKLRLRDEILRFAEYDELTGLLNHRMVFERLRGEVDRARRDGLMLSVILADLDHFKQVNMAYGHAAGDQILKEVASIILRSVRSYDWVGRYSGDEFLLVLPGSSPAAARYRAEQLRDAVQATRVNHGEDTLVVTASLGVASGFPSDEEELIQTVDRALHMAKLQGRNCVMALEIDPPDRFIAP